MDHLLEIRNLSIELPRGKRKPPVKLVEGVDLSIGKRQNFGVVGESGCGKSITCSSIMGLLSFPLTVGRESSIRFQQSDGREVDIASLPPSAQQGHLHDLSGAHDGAGPHVHHRGADL